MAMERESINALEIWAKMLLFFWETIPTDIRYWLSPVVSQWGFRTMIWWDFSTDQRLKIYQALFYIIKAILGYRINAWLFHIPNACLIPFKTDSF
jgi:hypothetical protein